METTIERQEIGKRVSELMFMLNLNQSTFAEKVGTTQTTVRNVSKGLTKPRYELLENICSAFPGLNKDWLMQGIGEAFPSGGPKTPNAGAKPKANDYLMEQLQALEKSWKNSMAEKDRTIQETQQMIAQQKFIIETLMSQLNTALGKLNLGEEMLPEREAIVIPFSPIRITENNTPLAASLTVGM
jgi:transcriptional regulator with XRE-family HTH domain